MIPWHRTGQFDRARWVRARVGRASLRSWAGIAIAMAGAAAPLCAQDEVKGVARAENGGASACTYDDRVALLLDQVAARALGLPETGVSKDVQLPKTAGGVAWFDGGTTVGVLVEGESLAGALETLQAQIGTQIAIERPGRGPWLTTLRLPVEQLPTLVALASVRHVEAAGVARLDLNASVPALKADLVHNASGTPPVYAGPSGVGVLVGVVDSGIDPAHQDFYDGSGSYRIEGAWDQEDAAPAPGPPAPFSYGTGWTKAALQGGTSRLTDTDGHGTNVAGIAAGSGRATGNARPAYRYVGVAPEARIVAVKTNLSDTGIVDGVAYVFQKATSLGLSAVANLSLGSQFGPHDGTSSVDVGLDALSGPGRVVVAAAGNEGAAPIHAEGNAAGGLALTLNVASYTASAGAGNDYLAVNAWARDQANLTVRVQSPNNAFTVGPVAEGAQSVSSTVDGRIEVRNGVGGVQPNGLRSIDIRIYDLAVGSPPRAGTWTFTFTATAGAGTEEVDAWIYLDSIGGTGKASFVNGHDALEVVGSPGSANKVIAVASYVSKTSWQSIDGNTYSYTPPPPALGSLSSFSSKGPRRDNALKPDIAAPGHGIMSSLSGDVTRSPAFDALVDPDGQHFLLQGTSQACPHVSGTVALMMELFPNLNPAQAKQYMACGGRSDAQTGVVPNSSWGYGKLDAQAATGTCLVPAVVLLDFAAAPRPGGVALHWQLPDAGALTKLQLFRREGSGAFLPLSTLPASAGAGTYFDATPLTQPRRYRMLGATADQIQQWLGEVEVGANGSLPSRLTLGPNVPNPFNPSTLIPFTLPAVGEVDLAVFDARGRHVRTLWHGAHDAGSFSILFDGRGDDGARLASGVYQLRLEAAGRVQARAITMVQ